MTIETQIIIKAVAAGIKGEKLKQRREEAHKYKSIGRKLRRTEVE